jgi:hypothetical protein
MENFSLKSFFIFDPSLRSKLRKPTEDEQQDAKLLYYYPNEEDLVIRRSNIGIIEGTLGFLDSFQESGEDKFLLTELSKLLYISDVLDGCFFVFILEYIQGSEFTYHQDIEIKKSWYKRFLTTFYENFVLYNGPVKELFFRGGEDIRDSSTEYGNLIQYINDFVLNYFDYLNKPPFIDNILYFPLNQNSYTHILLSTQRLHEKIHEIRYTSVLYKGYLLHNDIPLETYSLLYNALFNNLDANPKYPNFLKPPYKVVQTVNTGIDEVNGTNTITNYRKGFEINNPSMYLIGIHKLNINNYHLFIPTLYIASTRERLKLLVYLHNGLMIVLLLSDTFNPSVKINSLIKLEKWVKRYFDEELPILENLYLQKTSKMDSISFAYVNGFNKSVKLSSTLFNKKIKSLEKDKNDLVMNIFKYNSSVSCSSMMRIKGLYVYYISVGDRKVVIFLPDNLVMLQVSQAIEDIKKELFDYIYML